MTMSTMREMTRATSSIGSPRPIWVSRVISVIADPPSYQKGSFVAIKDYARLVRRLPDLLAPGGHALLCLNAPELGTDFLHQQVRELAPELVFTERVPNPPAFADVDAQRALKVLAYRAPG